MTESRNHRITDRLKTVYPPKTTFCGGYNTFCGRYKEDPIKNEGARVFTTLYINFSDTQGQITLELVVVSGQNLNSSKLSCMSLLPARMKMINSKMKELECSQDFSHYKSMGIFPDAQGQLTPQSLVESGPNLNLSKIL